MIEYQTESVATDVLLFPIPEQVTRDATGGLVIRARWEWADPVEAERRRTEREREHRVLQERIEELEQQLAEIEHIRLVEQASRTSARSLAAGWDNPLDAQYDDL